MRVVISIVKPKMFIAENVKGLTTLDNVKEIIEHDFSQATDGGYFIIQQRYCKQQIMVSLSLEKE